MSFACLVRFCLLHDMPIPQRSTFLPFTFQPRCRIRQAGVAQSTRDQKRKSKKWQAGEGRKRLGCGCKDFCFHPYLVKWSNLTTIFFGWVGWNHQLEDWDEKLWHRSGCTEYQSVIVTIRISMFCTFFYRQGMGGKNPQLKPSPCPT